MQYLKIDASTTLSDLSEMVGARNVDNVLALNSLTRAPNIGQQFENKCRDIVAKSAAPVSWQRKTTLLNGLTSDYEIFQTAALMTESEWCVYSTLGTLPNSIKLPDSLRLPNSANTFGSSSDNVSDLVYNRTINSLKQSNAVDERIFSEYSTRASTFGEADDIPLPSGNTFSNFNLPWGKITLYSSLADDTVDFPVYPEELSDSRSATYTTMPDTIYQYEPWQVYQSSGPREMTYKFHFHRDMWTGDHRDGNAAKLVRFCEANCYPNYSGSAVYTSTVRLYINGAKHISGVMTNVSTDWAGPIGLDGFYLECNLTLTIVEVADAALNFNVIRNMGLIGD